MTYEEVKRQLLADPEVREAYENPPLPLIVARRVVERRKELGMTQGQLADAIETSQAQVWRIESGHFNPTAKTLDRLERALDMSFGDVYRGLPRDEQLSPRAQLEQWRKTGILVMSDKDFESALELGEADPDQLDHLARTIRRILDEQDLEPGDEVRLTVKVEYEGESTSSAKADSPRGHLELIAAFS